MPKRLSSGMQQDDCVVYNPSQGIAPAVLMAGRFQRTQPSDDAIFRLDYPHWVVNYVCQGGLLERIGLETSPWRVRAARSLHCYEPGLVCWEDWSSVAGTRISGLFLVVRDDGDGPLRRLIGHRRCLMVDDPQGFVEARMARAFATGMPSFWGAQEELAGILDLVVGARPLSDGTMRLDDIPAVPALSAAVDVLLRRDLARRWDVAEIAAALGLSPTVFRRRLRVEAGMTPVVRLARLRVERVQELLLTGAKLDEVAQAAGFCDRFHCSRVFRRVAGMSPGAFARLGRSRR